MRLVLTKWEDKYSKEIFYTIGNSLSKIQTFRVIDKVGTLESSGYADMHEIKARSNNKGSEIKYLTQKI